MQCGSDGDIIAFLSKCQVFFVVVADPALLHQHRRNSRLRCHYGQHEKEAAERLTRKPEAACCGQQRLASG